MIFSAKRKRPRGLTLIELLVVLVVAAILVTTVFFMFEAGFSTYSKAYGSVILTQAADKIIKEIGGGSFENNGIKDGLEILEIGPSSIKVLPLWVDTSHLVEASHTISATLSSSPFTMNKPIRPGTGGVIVEEYNEDDNDVTIVASEFSLSSDGLSDQVTLLSPVDIDSEIRFLFHPSESVEDDCAMTIRLNESTGRVERIYKGQTLEVPLNLSENIWITDFVLKYYDNTNTLLPTNNSEIPNITGIRVLVKAVLLKKDQTGPLTDEEEEIAVSHEASAFLSLRNTRSGGKGILLRQGTQVALPSSDNVRVLSLANITGVAAGDIVELTVTPSSGNVWLLRLNLGLSGEDEVIEDYVIEYPAGTIVNSGTLNTDTAFSLDLLSLGSDGLYDYDNDTNVNDVVLLGEGSTLTVTRMDVDGAVLFVRP